MMLWSVVNRSGAGRWWFWDDPSGCLVFCEHKFPSRREYEENCQDSGFDEYVFMLATMISRRTRILEPPGGSPLHKKEGDDDDRD